MLQWFRRGLMVCGVMCAVAVGGLVNAAAPPTSPTSDREWIPYKRFLEITFVDRFYQAPLAQRDRLRVRASMAPSNKAIKAGDVVFTIAHAQSKQRIAVREDGTFELIPTATVLAENPMVYTSMPAGEKAAFGINFYAVLPDDLKLSYADLTGGIAQGNALIKAQAGMFSLFAPKLNGVVLRFAKPGAQTLQVLTKAGPKSLAADAAGVIKLKWDEALATENPALQFSERPLEVEIDAI